MPENVFIKFSDNNNEGGSGTHLSWMKCSFVAVKSSGALEI
jgi:hypothetical protein